MKKDEYFYIDKNNNKFNVEKFSEAEAEAASKTLINCYNCYNCYDCENCNGCKHCKHCKHCENCENCIKKGEY